ncbi:MAG: hypothetical protein FWF31_07810 [Desulfobulbus sp.]|nr:hypothetical protein [Desulfobulbus sp.]
MAHAPGGDPLFPSCSSKANKPAGPGVGFHFFTPAFTSMLMISGFLLPSVTIVRTVLPFLSRALIISRVDFGAGLYQEADHLWITVESGQHQGRPTVFLGSCVRIRTARKRGLDRLGHCLPAELEKVPGIHGRARRPPIHRHQDQAQGHGHPQLPPHMMLLFLPGFASDQILSLPKDNKQTDI